MLRTNLATRPFYNAKAVRTGIAIVAIVVIALTAFNVLQVLALNARNSELSARAEDAERQAAAFTQQAQAIRQSLNTAEMTTIQQAAREANLLIDRRVFSWTELFNQFERTLPPDVRIAAVEPQVDNNGRMLVAVTVISRRAEELNEFMDQLEASGQFRDVLNRQDLPLDDGMMRSVIQGYYNPPAAPTTAPAPASDSGDRAGNESTPRATNGTSPAAEGAR
jgi:hypothetical protein